MSEQGAFRRHPGGCDQDQALYGLGSLRREPQTDVATHRVADQVRLTQTYRLHPSRQPRCGLGEDEVAAEAAHRPEAWKVHQVNSVLCRKGRSVPGPPTGGAGEAVYQDEGIALAYHLVANFVAPHPGFALGSLYPYLLPAGVGPYPLARYCRSHLRVASPRSANNYDVEAAGKPVQRRV